jgi:hypothetical protein
MNSVGGACAVRRGARMISWHCWRLLMVIRLDALVCSESLLQRTLMNYLEYLKWPLHLPTWILTYPFHCFEGVISCCLSAMESLLQASCCVALRFVRRTNLPSTSLGRISSTTADAFHFQPLPQGGSPSSFDTDPFDITAML